MNESELSEVTAKAQQGDRAAFAALVAHYYTPIFKMACKWCGNRDDAEDIAQDVCIKLARAIGSYQGQAAFSSWLYRLVINAGVDFYRARKPAGPLGADPDNGQSSGEAALYAREMLARVYALPAKEKTALLLVFNEGLSHKDAAGIMGCKESTVSWYIHEARKKLQEFSAEEREHG